MQVDDLFTKIGILTVESDVLRSELNQAREQIKELARSLEDERRPATVNAELAKEK